MVLVDGQARGVWSYAQRKSELEVRVTTFSRLPKNMMSQVREEASELGKFLGCPNVKTVIA